MDVKVIDVPPEVVAKARQEAREKAQDRETDRRIQIHSWARDIAEEIIDERIAREIAANSNLSQMEAQGWLDEDMAESGDELVDALSDDLTATIFRAIARAEGMEL